MKFKKRFIVICLIICLFAMASVSASDDDIAIQSGDDTLDEVIASDEADDNEIKYTSDENDVLNAASFRILQVRSPREGYNPFLLSGHDRSRVSLLLSMSSFQGMSLSRPLRAPGKRVPLPCSPQRYRRQPSRCRSWMLPQRLFPAASV